MVIYEAIFFDEESIRIIESLEKNPLEQKVKNMHCTFKFRPNKEELCPELLGQEFELFLIGYGCDGKNSGFEVQLPKELKEKYHHTDKKTGQMILSHMTVSYALNSTPKHTKDINFQPLETKVKVTGRFGYFMDNGTISYHSY